MANDLRSITDFDSLLEYLADELDWPVENYTREELTFEYDAEDLGLKEEEVAKLSHGSIQQLRPLQGQQPFGIFFVEFDHAKLPIVVLRRILSQLVIKKRSSANSAEAKRWDVSDLIFISAFGEEDHREIAFAHFHKDPETTELPVLRVLGWHGEDTQLKSDAVARTLKSRLSWPENEADQEAWRQQWRSAFKHKPGHTIRTAKELATAMAGFAKRIRNAARAILPYESESGRLRKLYKGFQDALIHDLSEDDFTTYYAETICYGLFTVAVSKTELSEGKYGTAVAVDDVAHFVPVTNPFLKEMLWSFLEAGGRNEELNFDDLGINEIVSFFNSTETDLPAVIRDFGSKRPGEDPVIHLYEDFLKQFDAKLRKKRGVYYTPKPVVSYIVRSVHELLQSEFGIEDGLASTVTWGEMIKKGSVGVPPASSSTKSGQDARAPLKLPPLTDLPGEERTISPEEPFVQILDPATGTATFLVEAVEVIHKHLTDQWTKQGLNRAAQITAWNEYVPKHLLPRLHGYELMMAPYAIAHMKIGLKLAATGYLFATEERARIFLTNALEPWVQQLPLIGFEALAKEAAAVNEIKRHKRFTVVIGNPPYSCSSSNKSAWIQAMLDDYKDGLGERKMYLDDDFIKFLRFAQYVANCSSRAALLGMITNSTYLDGITQRNMRQHLLNTFSKIQVTNLHGNAREGELAPNGAVDENVFDILQGVAVTVASGNGMQSNGAAKLAYRDVWGTRTTKYGELLDSSSPTWSLISPEPPRFAFVPSFHELEAEYGHGISIPELFPAGVTGVQTKRDELVFGESTEELRGRFEDFRSGRVSIPDIRKRYSAKDIPEWSLDQAVRKLEVDSSWHTRVATCLYRPFDVRPLFYSGDFIARDRREVMRHMLHPNIALVITRQSNPTEPWSELLVTDRLVEKRALASYSGEARVYPLYLADENGLGDSPANVSAIANRIFRERLGWQVTEPADARRMLNYIYAVGHSPAFRNRFETLIKRDYLRVPVTSNGSLAKLLSRFGGELTALHLLESPKLDTLITQFIGDNTVVSKVGWTPDDGGTVWIDGKGSGEKFKPGTSGFQGVPEEVWNFHIGGYQVCHKWLKDRKDRTLTAEDIAHYHKIVVALTETIRLMAEIDEVIETHGGWPGAFQTADEAGKSKVDK